MTQDCTPKPVESQESEVDIGDYAARGAQPPQARTYVVTIDGQKFKVHTPTPLGAFLLSLVHKRPCSDDLLAEFAHHETCVIGPDTEVDLKTQGLKGFLTVPKAVVTIFIDDGSYPIERGQRTVAEVLAKVGKSPQGYMLMEDKNGALVPVPVDQIIQIAGCEKFFTQVQSGGSSHP